MLRTLTSGLVLALTLGGVAVAEEFEVKMLNRSDAGTMVFEPAFLQIAPGDTVRFLASTKGHNVETIPKMIPDGADAFKGKINEEIEVTFENEGLYGLRCKPHFAMGMVMTINVGEQTDSPETFLQGRIPRKAKERFAEQLSNL